MKSVITLLAFLGSAAASSWVFWECDEYLNFCLEGGVCVSQDNFWVQYSEPNGGGDIEKSGLALNADGFTYCPVNGVNQGIAGNGDEQPLQVIYDYFDSSAPNDTPCPEGNLYEPDGTTLLGVNDGSGSAPDTGTDGAGFCASSEASCSCAPYVVVNSP